MPLTCGPLSQLPGGGGDASSLPVADTVTQWLGTTNRPFVNEVDVECVEPTDSEM